MPSTPTHTTVRLAMVLSDLRAARGYSQQELTDRLQIAAPRSGAAFQRATISHFECGRRLPTFLQMRALIDALECTPREARLLIDSAAVDDASKGYLAFSLAHRDVDDASYLFAWEEFVATASSPVLAETIPIQH